MRFFVYIAIFIFILSAAVHSQNQPQEKLEIVSYDSLKGSKTSQGFLYELVGNVHLRQGKAEMFCEQAKYWKDIHEVIIEQNVRMYDGAKILLADQVFYHDLTQIFIATGKVVLKDSIRQIIAKQVSYFKSEDRVEADFDVLMKDSINSIDIYGEHAEFNNAKDYALVTGDPILIKKDSTGKEELRITSLTMELFEGGDRAVVSDSVRIIQNKANATCGQAEFYRNKNEIILKQNPVAWQGGDRLSGELIHLFIKDNQLVKALVKDQAVVTSRIDTTDIDQRVNMMTGQLITMHFENEELYYVEVDNKATSYYYIYEDKEEKGMNKIIGDKIGVFIKDRKIERILVESNPQLSSGTYYPPGKGPEEEVTKIK